MKTVLKNIGTVKQSLIDRLTQYLGEYNPCEDCKQITDPSLSELKERVSEQLKQININNGSN